jgi:hypothetical protein
VSKQVTALEWVSLWAKQWVAHSALALAVQMGEK